MVFPKAFFFFFFQSNFLKPRKVKFLCMCDLTTKMATKVTWKHSQPPRACECSYSNTILLGRSGQEFTLWPILVTLSCPLGLEFDTTSPSLLTASVKKASDLPSLGEDWPVSCRTAPEPSTCLIQCSNPARDNSSVSQVSASSARGPRSHPRVLVVVVHACPSRSSSGTHGPSR